MSEATLEAPQEPTTEPEPTTASVTEPTPEEQEAAEEEEATSEQDETAEPTEEPTAPAGMGEKEIEKRFQRIEKRAETWRAAVYDVLGDLATDLQPCPRCLQIAPGFIYPIEQAPIPDEQKLAVKLSIGELAPPPLLQADDSFTCGKCGGFGEVLTGSRKPAQMKARCLECEGRGWVGARAAKLAQLPPEQRGAVNGDEAAAQEQGMPTDPWGRTRDDPLFGVMPGYERD